MAKKSSVPVVNSPYNNFKVGDILEVCFKPTEEPKTWTRFFPNMLRDLADTEWARNIVETNGAVLGVYSAKLAQDPSYRREFRTVTP